MEPLEKENERLSAEVRLLSRYVRSSREMDVEMDGADKDTDKKAEWAKKADDCAHQLYLRKCREIEPWPWHNCHASEQCGSDNRWDHKWDHYDA